MNVVGGPNSLAFAGGDNNRFEDVRPDLYYSRRGIVMTHVEFGGGATLLR